MKHREPIRAPRRAWFVMIAIVAVACSGGNSSGSGGSGANVSGAQTTAAGTASQTTGSTGSVTSSASGASSGSSGTGGGPQCNPGNLYGFEFENGTFDILTNGGAQPPNQYSVVSTGAFHGSKYAEATLGGAADDTSANMYWDGGTAHNDIWLTVAIKVTTPPSTGVAIQKMVIFREGGFNAQLGEMNQFDGKYIWNWLDGNANSTVTAAGPIASTLGQWNTWKFHLDQTGATPKLSVGFNGVDNVFTTTKPGAKLADPQIIDFGGILNAGSGPSKFGFDCISIGTVDPGWP